MYYIVENTMTTFARLHVLTPLNTFLRMCVRMCVDTVFIYKSTHTLTYARTYIYTQRITIQHSVYTEYSYSYSGVPG